MGEPLRSISQTNPLISILLYPVRLLANPEYFNIDYFNFSWEYLRFSKMSIASTGP